jgi:hypothetical protein
MVTPPSDMLFDSYKDVTSEVINKLLLKQGVSITQDELDKIKKIPGVKFDLPITDQTYSSFIGLVGKPNTKQYKAGVYIFTHKKSGSQYIGSSNSLSRRLDQYFTYKHFNQENSGLLLPLIKKDGFEAFTLEIFVMPPEFSSDYYFLFLEQYHLLHKKFKLNTQRIVNFRVNQGNNIYLYDLEGKTLFYSSRSLNQIKNELGIHYLTCNKCIKHGNSYLDFFKITDTPISGAKKSGLSLIELISLISEKQTEKKKKEFKNVRYTKRNAITIKEIETNKILEFDKTEDVVNYLKTSRKTIAKYLNTGIPYKGYIFYNFDNSK